MEREGEEEDLDHPAQRNADTQVFCVIIKNIFLNILILTIILIYNIIFIISTVSTIIMTMMSLTREDPTMMRNGCLTLCQFNIPQDVLFDYERLVVMMMMKMVMTIMMN